MVSDREVEIRLTVVGFSFIVMAVAMGRGSRSIATLFGVFGMVLALLTVIRLIRD